MHQSPASPYERNVVRLAYLAITSEKSLLISLLSGKLIRIFQPRRMGRAKNRENWIQASRTGAIG